MTCWNVARFVAGYYPESARVKPAAQVSVALELGSE
jgi:hypothetical protein